MGRTISLSILALGYIGIIYFIVDAFRREYQADRTLPIALAIVGILSFGLTTIIYFMTWRWQDRHFAYATDFCDSCITESSEVAEPLDLTTINFFIGGRLLGGAKKSSSCGSTIKTHCFYVFGIPVYSRGSFRTQCPAMGEYILRKRPLYWTHLLYIILMPAFLCPITQ